LPQQWLFAIRLTPGTAASTPLEKYFVVVPRVSF
jgi:hypothetical protein